MFSLRDVSLDSGTPSRTKVSNPAHGLELCACPVNYNSSSCQDPSLGFYRSKSPIVTSTIIIQLVGEAKPCECNDRSSVCDIETGHCRVSFIKHFSLINIYNYSSIFLYRINCGGIILY